MKRLIRISSRALGEPVHVRVYVYDHLDHLRRDAEAFSPNVDMSNAAGCCQAWVDPDTGRPIKPLVRLHCAHLGTEVITHEMHHATTALYGTHIGTEDPLLTHYNEPFAYLHGEMCRKLVDRLYALGYYAN